MPEKDVLLVIDMDAEYLRSDSPTRDRLARARAECRLLLRDMRPRADAGVVRPFSLETSEVGR